MPAPFFASPILNGPYHEPQRHWQLSEDGQPTDKVQEGRRRVDFTSAVPKPKRTSGNQAALELGAGQDEQGTRYETSQTIEAIRRLVTQWRRLTDESRWNVNPATARLLRHWRREVWPDRRPFFCQVEAAETIIWLTEVAPRTSTGKDLLQKLAAASQDANPGLERWALKLATGAGKTTVMAMLIAWQCVNAARLKNSRKFTNAFLIVAPGITIRDRLRVLLPTDTEAYYKTFDLVPEEMLGDIKRAQIVITNFHAFQLRETRSMPKVSRGLMQGHGEEIKTLETPGQMLARVAPELLRRGGIMVLNDEAHHCYRERPAEEADEDAVTIDKLKGDEKKQAKQDSEEARLWISGIEYASERIGVQRVIDLSATPFFLKGSGYREGTIFPWTVSDFSLMDAIESGIVKLPRVPVDDNIPSDQEPQYRNLWKHIGKKMPKKGRGKGVSVSPDELPQKLKTALDVLYGNYDKVAKLWEVQRLATPPCFIVVCNNTASSKLVYDYISGYEREDGTFIEGKLERFSNYDNRLGKPLAKPRTLLIDSAQLDSGDALDKSFKEAAAEEIATFRREIAERTGQEAARELSEEDLLREVMNTVGKPGKLGADIRCVVSVSMLTEGWDANTVTHVLGVRAFGTQLLCEQVMGRALRRYSYQIDPATGHFPVEYADILGIPFDFTAESVASPPSAPRAHTHVSADAEREHLEIRFPRVEGYRVEQKLRHIDADFTDDDSLVLTPEMVGATETEMSGITGEREILTVEHMADERLSNIIVHLTGELLRRYYVDADGNPYQMLYGPLKKVVRRWLESHLICKGGTTRAQVLHREFRMEAAQRINSAILRAATKTEEGKELVRVILDPYNPEGSTRHVGFNTTKDTYTTAPDKSHVTHVVEDSGWEGELARVLERHPQVLRYVKNQGLGFEVPYVYKGTAHRYVPDFIVAIDDGRGLDGPLYLIAEVKGQRDDQVKAKHNTVRDKWLAGVNFLQTYGRWAFAEFDEPFAMREDLDAVLAKAVATLVEEGRAAFAKTENEVYAS